MDDQTKKAAQDAIQEAIARGNADREMQRQLQTQRDQRAQQQTLDYEATCRLEAQSWVLTTLPGIIRASTAEGRSSALIGCNEQGRARAEACHALGLFKFSTNTRRSTRIRSDGEYEDGDGWQTDYTVHW